MQKRVKMISWNHFHPKQTHPKVQGVREERCKDKIILKCVIKEETKKLDEKPLYDPPSRNDPLVNKLEYKDAKRLSKPNLPKVLKPSKLQLLMDFSESVFTSFLDPAISPDCIRQTSLAHYGKFPMLPKLQISLYTLNRCVLCLGTNLLSRYNNESKKRE